MKKVYILLIIFVVSIVFVGCNVKKGCNEHTIVVDDAILPTCTKAGKSEGKHCKICGEILVAQEEVPATGHIEEIDSEILPTCTKVGKS